MLRFNRYTNNWNRDFTDYPSDVKTTAFLVGGVYELTGGEDWSLRLLLDFAHTSYTTSGASIGESVDSSLTLYRTAVAGTWSSDGNIADVRGGI